MIKSPLQFYKPLWMLAISCLTIACSKSNSTPAPAPPPPPPPPVVTPFLTLPPSWKYNATLSSAYPAGIQVYTFDSLQDGEKVKAFAVAFDSKAGTVELKPVMSTTAKKPSQFFTSETGSVLACINGGFFGSGQSFSTVRYGSVTQSPNIRALNRVFNGSSTAYFPTRAALGIGASGAPSVAWIYHPAGNDDLMYRYPQPSPNVEGQAPQPTPDANFPAGGSIWNVHTAIGGAPMLIFNGNIQITDVAEMISINNNSARPRSAIGYNANGIVLLVAVEGDNPTAGYAGLSLPKLAKLLQSFSLTYAINLDGGGSTSLILNNQLTVRPGDNGLERPVISAVLLKRK